MGELIVAKDKHIEELYMYDKLGSEEESKLLKYPVADFEVLWQAGLFPAINDSCNVMITDYHMEIIPCDKLPSIVEAIDHAKLRIIGPYITQFCAALRDLCMEGINRGTSLIVDL